MADADTFSEGHGAGFLRAILDRFRRSAGVPAAASDDLSAELAPLFSALDSVDAEAGTVRTAARRRAAAIAEEAQAEIERILSAAKEQAEGERIEAIEAGRRAAEMEAQAVEASALREAEEVGRIGRARIPPLVAEVLRCVETSPR